MKTLAILLSVFIASSLLAATKQLQPDDIRRATDAYTIGGQKEEFLNKVLIPVYRASAIVMTKNLPGAADISQEIMQSLERLYDSPDSPLPYIAAHAFMNRPDLFHNAMQSVSPDARPRAIAKFYPGWVKLREEIEKKPETSTNTRTRLQACNTIIENWKDRYPQLIPQKWKK